MSDEDDLFGSSDSGGDTDDLIADAKKVPAAKKRLQKKAAAPAAAKKRKLPDADKDDDDDLFADSEDDEPAKAKKPLSKRERMDALQKKKRQDTQVSQKKKKANNRLDSVPGGESGDEKKEKGYDSGDSYESANFQRTKEDNDFIDMDGEDEDAIKELYSEQRFDDERPDGEDDDEDGGGRKKKKSSSAPRRRGPDALSDDDDEDGADANPIMAVVKKMKKKKRVAKKQTELEDEAKEFITKMENAAEDDEQAFKAKRPATKKLMLLSDVVDMLTRRDMIRLLLDMDVLAACKRWIQPLSNGALGNVTVRQRIIECITNMTGDQGISSHDLKRSGIGQTIMRLFKHKSETPNMKRTLKKLIEQWSRPIFQKSGNMKDLQNAQSNYKRDPQGLSAMSAAMRQSPKTAPVAKMARKQGLQSLIASGKTGIQKEELTRVRVPYSTGFQFTVRPESKTGNVADKRMVRPGAPKDNRGNLSKRMVEKGRAASKNQGSAGLSIEGRATK
mmetsp:Transcript_16677/g.27654  ORF Transcript_16677/g.27654 Transcript_16677/m.27654 type:complete len:503 (-) Transcript_16677:332-1840(-)|eukprot:CAMPEP_0119016152 /NCGR_PEP_ID=MMETSP1176-20130426/11843_1 /TAXON_ID=265551 /ORGANISM="Synedropsis recta cf, Strain CCMP1620" /LENGTH=502 /DNA_ID=CAMNT_0006969485 /DNA_START=246 /DNA_END=1754 /DNA_ORIENTATION=-